MPQLQPTTLFKRLQDHAFGGWPLKQPLVTEQALNADEKFLLKNGCSNQGSHYYGSAKFFAQAGRAFADALASLKKP